MNTGFLEAQRCQTPIWLLGAELRSSSRALTTESFLQAHIFWSSLSFIFILRIELCRCFYYSSVILINLFFNDFVIIDRPLFQY